MPSYLYVNEEHAVKKSIVILEDNDERRDAMTARIMERLPMYNLFITDDPNEFIRYVQEYSRDILVVSLDHDLYERFDQSTELTGMLVVDHLIQCDPTFPVLLHTSNQPDGERMQTRLREVGWTVEWITPFLDTAWIIDEWYPALKRAIRSKANYERVSVMENTD